MIDQSWPGSKYRCQLKFKLFGLYLTNIKYIYPR